MTRRIKMLSDLMTSELTVTKRGANDRRYALTKRLNMDPKLVEVLKALATTPVDGEDAVVETLKADGLEGEKLDAALLTLRMQKGMKDLVADETFAAVSKAAGYVAKAVAPEEGVRSDKTEATAGKPDPKAKQKDTLGKAEMTEDEDMTVEKSLNLADLDAETRGKVENVFKSHAAMEERTAQLEAVVKSLQDEKRTAEFVAKADSNFRHLPMAAPELGNMLKSAHDVSPDFATGFEGLLGRMNEMVQQSSMMTTMGSVSKNNGAGGAMEKIATLADGIVQKSLTDGKSMSKAQAMDLVMKTDEGRALYQEYLADNPAQRAKSNY